MSAEWTDEDIEGVLKTTACAVIVAGILYCLFFPKIRGDPAGQEHRQQQNANIQQRQMQQQQRGQVRGQGQVPSRQNYNRHGLGSTSMSQEEEEDEDGIAAYLKKHTRKPPHYEATASNSNNSAHRHDGIVPFRLTKAAHYEMKQKAALALTNEEEEAKAKALEVRKDRARIFAKLFASNNALPPARGGTLVLSINSGSGSAASMQKMLSLLGTYYNLFVMVALKQEDGSASASGKSDEYTALKQKTKEIVDQFYTSSHSENENENNCLLSRDVLPPHRIIMTRSVASRIAFVRAFPKSPEYVISIGLDDGEDVELKDQLTKFGFNVMLRSSASILV